MHRDLPRHIVDDAMDLLLGEKLGEGASRITYACGTDSKFVIKVEKGDSWFQNTAEWLAWDQVRDTKWAKWFAPCHTISPGGRILLMERVEPLPRSLIPKRLPSFLTDVKLDNFGLLKGRPVVCDYGLNLFTSEALRSVRLRKVPRKEWT